MKLNAIHKTLIMILITGAVLGLGFYFFISPNIEEMNKIEADIEAVSEKIAQARQAEAEEEQVRAEYGEAAKRPAEAQKVFYDEMTDIEYEWEVNQILRAKNLKSVSGIRCGKLRPITLNVSIPQSAAGIDYELRNYSFLEEGQLGSSSTEETESIDKSDTTLADLMVLLHEKDSTREERIKTAKEVREMLYGESVTISVVEAKFSLTLTTREFRAFLDYLNSLERAVAVSRAEFKDEPVGEKLSYDFTLNLYVIRKMQTVEDLFGSEEDKKTDELGENNEDDDPNEYDETDEDNETDETDENDEEISE